MYLGVASLGGAGETDGGGEFANDLLGCCLCRPFPAFEEQPACQTVTPHASRMVEQHQGLSFQTVPLQNPQHVQTLLSGTDWLSE